MVLKGGATMPKCKNCKSKTIVKNGTARGKQRYKCKSCGYNFVAGDGRTNDRTAAKKAMCVIMYSLGKVSYNMLAHVFDTWPSLVHRWIAEAGAKVPGPQVPSGIREMEFDEMWHFVGSKKTGFGSSRPLTAAYGEPWPGRSVVVILQRPGCSTRR